MQITYPYLCFSLSMLAMAGICFAIWPSGWRSLLAAGALCAPFALFSFEFIPDYWNPHLLAWWWIVSPEDLIFSFSSGVIGWFAACWIWRVRLYFVRDPRARWRRWLTLCVLGIGVGYLLRFTVPNPQVMPSTLAGVGCVGAWLAWRRRDLWPLALSGGLVFVSLYIVGMLLIQAFWPQFWQHWTPHTQLPVSFFGMPLYEVVWAAAYGIVWPLSVAHIIGARLIPAPAPRVASLTQIGEDSTA